MTELGSTTVLALTVAVLAGFAGFAVWASRGRVAGVEDYITARGSTGRWPLTATLVASVMGVWILFNPAEAGIAFGGVGAVLGYAVGEAVPMLAYAKLAPRIREAIPEGHSLTEYAYARYGPAMYAFVLLVSLFYMFVFLAAELTAITGAHSLVAGVPRWQTAALVGGFVLVYTGYGGLRASIVTDALQAAVVVPLLVVAFVGALFALGGPGAAWGDVAASNPDLVTVSASNPTFLTGLQFGVWVSLAVLGAELVNQVWWQRIYAAAAPADLPRAFGVAAVVNFVLVFLAGLFGVVAAGQASFGEGGHVPANGLFVLLQQAFPAWLVVAVVLLAVLLVMSTADSLFNGMASVVTADLPRLLDDPDDRTLRLAARALTVVVALAALLVSLRARSVLRLFLLADLLGAAVAFPLLYGLYSRRVTGTAALAGGLSGLVVGVAFFPNPVVRGALAAVFGGLLPTPSFLVSFVGAATVSVVVTVAAARATSAEFDVDRLATEIRSLDAPARTDAGRSTTAPDAED
jgi:Na+/proline symporter